MRAGLPVTAEPQQSQGLTQHADELRALTGSSAAVLALAAGGEVRFGCSGSTVPNDAGSVPADTNSVPTNASSVLATLDTLFDLASITKVMATTASLMRLVTLGALAVDDRVSQYLPAFTGGGKDAVTLRDLLLHRGGLQPWWPLYCDPSSRGTDDGQPNGLGADRGAALDAAVRLPLAFAPQTAHHYSDLGFMLLGAIVEGVTEQRLDAAARELVFDPLGLAQTGFRASNAPTIDDAFAAGPFAAGSLGDRVERGMVESGVPYPVPFRAEDFDGWRSHLLVGEANDGNAFHAFGGIAGHAGLFSSVGDLLAFGTALSALPLSDLFHPDVLAEFFAPGPDAAQSLGFRRYEISFDDYAHDEAGRTTTADRTTTVLGHPGFTGTAFGFVPSGTSAPTHPLAFAVATNRLLAPGDPVTNDRIWEHSLPVWRSALAELAPHLSRHPKEA